MYCTGAACVSASLILDFRPPSVFTVERIILLLNRNAIFPPPPSFFLPFVSIVSFHFQETTTSTTNNFNIFFPLFYKPNSRHSLDSLRYSFVIIRNVSHLTPRCSRRHRHRRHRVDEARVIDISKAISKELGVSS